MAKTIIPKGALPHIGDLTEGAVDTTPDGDVTLVGKPPAGGVVFNVETGFRARLWYLLTNPILYLFTGKIRW
jgi:hypothetical protein